MRSILELLDKEKSDKLCQIYATKNIPQREICEMFFIAPPVGLEPTTLRLTAECSTDWAKEEYFLVLSTKNILSYLDGLCKRKFKKM